MKVSVNFGNTSTDSLPTRPVMIGVESRTSSPVRIIRDCERCSTLQ